MLYGNQKIVETLSQYLEQFFTKGKGVPFFILVGPRGIGKSSHAQALIQQFLGDFYPNDFLYLKDYSDLIGKVHGIPVEINKSNEFVSKSSKKKKEENSDSFDEEYSDIEGEKYPNIGVREMTEWLQTAPFGDKKMVLIENLERANKSTGGAAMNALLKTLEEPLPQRVIIATVQEETQILPTILSRAIVLHFSQLSDEEMQQFMHEISSGKLPQDPELITILLEMAMGRPGIFLSFVEKIGKQKELSDSLKGLFLNLGNRTTVPLYTLQNYFQNVIESGGVIDFVDTWISYCLKKGKIEEAQKWIQAKQKSENFGAGVSWERLFLDLMVSTQE